MHVHEEPHKLLHNSSPVVHLRNYVSVFLYDQTNFKCCEECYLNKIYK